MASQHSAAMQQASEECSGVFWELLSTPSLCALEDPMECSFWHTASNIIARLHHAGSSHCLAALEHRCREATALLYQHSSAQS